MAIENHDRRAFLRQSLAGGRALALAPWRLAGAAGGHRQPPAGKIGNPKISMAEWSLHKALFAKQMTNLDFPKVAREHYGIEGVEFVNQFFKDNYRNELKGVEGFRLN